MSIGKVTVWYMTEEERLAYIAKHPIVPIEKPSGQSFSNIHEFGERAKELKKESVEINGKLIDKVDKDFLHKLFIVGKTFHEIADALNISVSTLNKYVCEQRKINPEKWPVRSQKKKR